jgi:hypothetical protein
MALNEFDELITKYQKALDTVMVLDSASAVFEGGAKWAPLNFDENGTVKIMRIQTSAMGNYRAANQATYTDTNHSSYPTNDGYKIGNVAAQWEQFTLQWNRGIQFRIDEITDKQLAGLVLAHTATEFYRTQVVPEVDTLRFSTLASKANASLGNLVTETPTALNDSTGIIHCFNTGFQYLTEMGVRDEDQVIVCNPSVMSLIRNTAELTKFLDVDKRTVGAISVGFTTFLGREIKVCPSDRFITNAIATEDGALPTASSVTINYMIADRKAAIPVTMLKKVKTYGPEVVQDFDGSKINFHLFHGIFVPTNKVPAIYVSVATKLSNFATAALRVSLSAGEDTNGWVLNAAYSIPGGKLGTVVVSATAQTVGSTVTIDGTNIKEIKPGVENIDATATGYFFSLVDGTGLVVAATSAKVTLPKKA